LRLPQIVRAGEKDHLAIGRQIEALEVDVSECVVARQIVHALLAEHEKAAETLAPHLLAWAPAPLGKLLVREMNWHGSAPG
jgi:hypothetical protein